MKLCHYKLPALLAACLLQACSSTPSRTALAIAPVLRVEDSAGFDAPALYQLGRYHQQRGELAAADAAFVRSIAQDPQQLDARNARAALLASQGQLDAAVAMLQQLVTDFPDQVQPRSNLGYAYHLQGRDQAALATLEQALLLDPSHAQTRANLALLQPARTPTPAAPRLAIAAPAKAKATASAAPAVSVSVAATAAAPAPLARMEVVQLAPNEFRLQSTAVSATPQPLVAKFQPAPLAAAAPVVQRIQIVNGNGVRGVGERVRALLARNGIAAGRVVNQRGHYQRTTIIEYLPAQQQQANAVLAALQGHARLLPARSLPDGLTLRLVLGHDHAARLAALDPAPVSTLAPQLAALDSVAVPHFNQE